MKYATALAAILLAFLIHSCSKEKEKEMETLTSVQNNFFFIKMYMPGDSILNQGIYDPLTKAFYGPSVFQRMDGDRSIIEISSYGTFTFNPSLHELYFNNSFSKPGTTLLGEYKTYLNPASPWLNFTWAVEDLAIFQDKVSVKLISVNENSAYGRYVEGSLSFNCYSLTNPGVIIPVSGSFRLKLTK
jgi:hypothetical protein